MSRVQLAIRVDDLDASVDFYSKLFNAPVAKRRPGYANFAIDDPPLKLVLLGGGRGETTRLDHLGVEVASPAEVAAAAARLAAEGLSTEIQDGTTCCYAVQDKVWVTGPGDEPWEIYAVLADYRADLEGVTDADPPSPLAPLQGEGGGDVAPQDCCGLAPTLRRR
jgi:catechol 2,3-dioxygenase-like lactoylglutathione lyase family enzyme